jgi:hypothetical protein
MLLHVVWPGYLFYCCISLSDVGPREWGRECEGKRKRVKEEREGKEEKKIL